MFELNANLRLNKDDDRDRFLEFVGSLNGVKVVDEAGTNSFVWFNLTSNLLGPLAMETLLRSNDFDIDVFDSNEHECTPEENSHVCQAAS